MSTFSKLCSRSFTKVHPLDLNLADEFLSSLRQVPDDDLLDSTCIICKEEYRAWASAPANGDVSLSSWEVSHLVHLGDTENSNRDSTPSAAVSGEEALRLPCGHIFGDECIYSVSNPSNIFLPSLH